MSFHMLKNNPEISLERGQSPNLCGIVVQIPSIFLSDNESLCLIILKRLLLMVMGIHNGGFLDQYEGVSTS